MFDHNTYLNILNLITYMIFKQYLWFACVVYSTKM